MYLRLGIFIARILCVGPEGLIMQLVMIYTKVIDAWLMLDFAANCHRAALLDRP
jgi:hypothetical protein